MFDKIIFGNRVKTLRTSIKASQSTLGDFLGVTKTQISDIENGKIATTLEKTYLLADYFDVCIDFLVGRTNIRNFNIAMPPTPILAESSTLSGKEANFLKLYKALNAESQLKLQERAEALLDMQEDFMIQQNATTPKKGA